MSELDTKETTTFQKAYQLHEKQLEVFNDTTRFRICVAGRRFGKSIIAVEELIRYALVNTNSESLAICKDNSVVERIYRKPIAKQLKSIGVIEGVHYTYQKSKKTFQFHIKNEDGSVNESLITLVSCNKFIRGITLDFVVFDEYDYLDNPELWEEDIEPTLLTTGGKALFISTPNGTSGELKKLFDRGEDPEFPEYKSFKYKTLDNPLIKPKEVEKKRKMLHPKKFRAEYEAEFEDVEGKICYDFSYKNHVQKLNIDYKFDLCLGCDFNVTWMSWVAFQIIPKEFLTNIKIPDGYTLQDDVVVFLKEFQTQNFFTSQQIEEVRSWLQEIKYDGDLNVYGDRSGMNRQSSQILDNDRSLTDFIQIENLLPKVFLYNNKVNPEHRNRTNAVNAKILNSNKEIGILVDSDCKNLIKDFESVRWDSTGFKIDKSREKYGEVHLFDAATYPIYYEFDLNERQPSIRLIAI